MKKLVKSILAVALGTVVSHAQTAMNAASLPLFFEAGHGQAGISTPYAAHGPDSEFLMTATNAQFVLRKPSGETASTLMEFLNASSSAQITGETELPGKVNYLLGNEPAKWQSNLPAFAKVHVQNIYPGINVVYYGNGRQLEYDFDLAAGVDPKTIVIRFSGADSVSISPQGELVVSLNGGKVIQHRPVAYQQAGQTRHEINSGYQLLDDHTATFALGDFDHNQPLVIDPVLGYSTYFDGNNGDVIRAIALGNDGSIYVAGYTMSTVISNAAPGYTNTFQGGGATGDAFVAKFDNTGTVFKYFTYLGGSADDLAFGLAVDNSGQAFVTGFTDSPNFPTTANVFQPHIAGSPNPVTLVYPTDAFVAELNTSGSGLVYSTYLGGNETDGGTAIAVDTNTDDAYVVGYTYSTNFPATRPFAYQGALQCPETVYYNANAFVAEIAPGGTGRKYVSYLGGTNYDKAMAVALDSAKNIYVAGYTSSTNFPIVNPLQGNAYLNGSPNGITLLDAFVTKFTPGFTNNPGIFNRPVYSTFLGGSNYDIATGITADSAGNAYVVGSTTSTNFPVTTNTWFSYLASSNTIQGLATVTNSFLAKIGWNGTSATNYFSTVFGGAGNDAANGVALDAAGNIFVVGSASSTNFPVTTNNISGSLSATNSATSPTQTSDVFVTAFYSNGFPIYSAYLGGYLDDFGFAITVDPAGNAYITGVTTSTNFPTFNASQTTLSGTYDGFLSKILLITATPVLAAISNQVIAPDVVLMLTNSATESNNPAPVFTYTLLSGPANATLNSSTGVFTWRPLLSQAGTTNIVSVEVTDNGTPPASATNSFKVIVTPVTLPSLSTILSTNGLITLSINGPQGPDYSVLDSTNLLSWQILFTTNSPALPFTFVQTNQGSLPALFYRVEIGP